MALVIPKDYSPRLSVRETQEAIKYIRDTFQKEFGKEMNLSRISAPLFVEKSSGLNDNLNGVERPVSFDVPWKKDEVVEVVQSLAKWKRIALQRYNFQIFAGMRNWITCIAAMWTSGTGKESSEKTKERKKYYRIR